jgi:hypothetical protein
MPTDHPSHAVAPAHNDHKTLGSRLHRFLIPVPKLEPPTPTSAAGSASGLRTIRTAC